MTKPTAIRYRETSPPRDLSPFVICWWEFTVESIGDEPYPHHVPPDGCTSLTIRYGGGGPPLLILFGPRTEPFRVMMDEPVRYFGCRFRPHAAAAILKQSGESLLNVSEPIGFRLPELSQRLFEALPNSPDPAQVLNAMESVLRERASAADTADVLVENAVAAIVASHGDLAISDIADSLDVSPRQLQRRFRAATGLTPKQFARIRRVRRATAELLAARPRPWIDVAYATGFSDQAHLAREFSQLIGLTAEEMRKRHDAIDHEDVDP